MGNFTIISLGGSLIVPDQIDHQFLKSFKDIILNLVEKGNRFLIISGGGKICRVYQAAARQITDLTDEDIDWLGIHVTHLNAHLLRTIFRGHAHTKVLTHYDEKIDIQEPIVIGAGWKPGHSTDFDAVSFAQLYGAKRVVNLSDIAFVYDQDPNQFPDATPLKNISWGQFRKMIGDVWAPGRNSPFDPIASKLAQEAGIEVVVMNGNDLSNFQNYIENKDFQGTTIR